MGISCWEKEKAPDKKGFVTPNSSTDHLPGWEWRADTLTVTAQMCKSLAFCLNLNLIPGFWRQIWGLGWISLFLFPTQPHWVNLLFLLSILSLAVLISSLRMGGQTSQSPWRLSLTTDFFWRISLWFYVSKLFQPNAEEATEAHLIPDIMLEDSYQKTLMSWVLFQQLVYEESKRWP